MVPLHPQEVERQAALENLGLLETPTEERFDLITKEALDKLHVPIATISLIDREREWFKSCQGLSTREGPREISFCGHALLAKHVFVVEDTLLDDRFKNNPYVTGAPFVRFYAGSALNDFSSGLPVGVFCVKDTVPRKFTNEELAIFMELADRAEKEVNHQA